MKDLHPRDAAKVKLDTEIRIADRINADMNENDVDVIALPRSVYDLLAIAGQNWIDYQQFITHNEIKSKDIVGHNLTALKKDADPKVGEVHSPNCQHCEGVAECKNES